MLSFRSLLSSLVDTRRTLVSVCCQHPTSQYLPGGSVVPNLGALSFIRWISSPVGCCTYSLDYSTALATSTEFSALAHAAGFFTRTVLV
jgi:hypothetical protein